MKKVVVSEYLPDACLDLLRSRYEVVYDPDLHGDRARLLDEAADAAAILIRNRTRIDEELIGAARDMLVVGRLGVGLDNIDLEVCDRARVGIIPAVGANAVSVAEYVMGAMLVLTRGVYGLTPSTMAGEWPRQGHAFGRELMGKTLGLVGLGSIARQVALRAASFEMVIVAHDPLLPEDDPAWETVGRCDRETLLSQSDVISIHVPLNDQTRNLIGADALQRMKPTAILINTSRGGTVDETALAAALRDGVIGGAALDVFATEPLGPESAATFGGLPNLLLTPHVAGNTEESVDRVAGMVVEAVIGALEGGA